MAAHLDGCGQLVQLVPREYGQDLDAGQEGRRRLPLLC
jgi:hypothetical protein